MVVYRRPVSARRSIKSRKARSAKRTYYRKAKSGGPASAGVITHLSPNNYGFPDRLKTKLIYADVVQLQASAGNPGIWQFRMNSLFDPDLTGTGHQPQWFDQLAAVYARYRVNFAKITATFVPNNVNDTETNDTGPYIIGISTNQNATFSAANYAALLENPNTESTVLVDKQGGNNMKTLSADYNPKRDFDISPLDGDLLTAVNANPIRTFIATVWALDMTESVSQDVVCKICIEYDVTMSMIRDNVVS